MSIKKWDIISLLLFLSVFFCSCSGTQKNEAENIEKRKQNNFKLEKILTIGIDEAERDQDKPFQFSSLYAVDCDAEGNIYALDGKSSCVRVFDQSGKFLREMFQRGKGPTEIYMAIKLKVSKFSNTLYILNNGGYTLKEFNLNGGFIKTIKLPRQFFDNFDFVGEEKLIYIALCQYGKTEYHNFEILDIPGGKILGGILELDYKKRDDTFNRFQRFVINDGVIWTSLINEMTLKSIDIASGNVLNNLPINGKFKQNEVIMFNNKRGGRSVGFVGYNYAAPISLNGDIHFILAVQDYDREKCIREELFFPDSSKLALYKVTKHEKFEKIGEVNAPDYMKVECTFKNRIIFSCKEPYPKITIIETNLGTDE